MYQRTFLSKTQEKSRWPTFSLPANTSQNSVFQAIFCDPFLGHGINLVSRNQFLFLIKNMQNSIGQGKIGQNRTEQNRHQSMYECFMDMSETFIFGVCTSVRKHACTDFRYKIISSFFRFKFEKPWPREVLATVSKKTYRDIPCSIICNQEKLQIP